MIGEAAAGDDGGAIVIGEAAAGDDGGAIVIGEAAAGDDGVAIVIGEAAAGDDGVAIVIGEAAAGDDGVAIVIGEAAAGDDGVAIVIGEAAAGDDGVAIVIGEAAAGDDGVAIVVGGAAAGDDGVAIVVAASGHHLDAHGWDPGRVGGRVGGVLEVVAGADRPGALGQGQPVALARLAAEKDLEAAVGVDVERGVVEHPHDLIVHRTPGLAGLHRDRHVGGALRLAGHPVGVVGGDGGVEVDGVGVVAQQLSVRGDDAMEPGGGRVALEQSDQAPL